MSNVSLNVADVRLRSRVNGPGIRSVIWVQGCTVGCPGCFNPHTHAHAYVHLLDPEELGRRLPGASATDGITISGGEPFEQAEACAILAETVQRRSLSVMVFTGYRYQQLRFSQAEAIRRFLSVIDLLVAGPYVARLRTNGSGWRASANQSIHALTDRMQNAICATSRDGPVVELTSDGMALASTGFPAKEDLLWLDGLLDGVAS